LPFFDKGGNPEIAMQVEDPVSMEKERRYGSLNLPIKRPHVANHFPFFGNNMKIFSYFTGGRNGDIPG
jgi:hypothetical protein